jgi:hypothetical protein
VEYFLDKVKSRSVLRKQQALVSVHKTPFTRSILMGTKLFLVVRATRVPENAEFA